MPKHGDRPADIGAAKGASKACTICKAVVRSFSNALIKLGCLRHVVTLQRLWSGPFTAAEGIDLATLDRLARSADLDRYLRPLEDGLAELPMVTCPTESVTHPRHGNAAMVFPGDVEFGDECWASHQGRAIAIGQYRSGELHPSRVFAD